MQNAEDALVNQMLRLAKDTEEKVDAELKKLENLDSDDLEKLRSERLEKMKLESKKRREFLSLGHGTYEELAEEKEFFNTTKKSENVVVHFYLNETARCKIFDHHLKLLAPQHIETKFVKINAEKCPFLCDRLKVKVIPTLIIVANGQIKDRIVGFTDLGNCDDFATSMLEWRLAHSAVIDYSGDLLQPPETKKPQPSSTSKRSIRDREDDDDESDIDSE